VAQLPTSAGIDHDRSVQRALSWSIAVVLAAGTFGAFTTPGATGQTVLQQGAGPAVPAEGPGPGPAAGSATTAPASAPTGAATPAPGSSPTSASPAATAALATATTKARTKRPTTTAAPAKPAGPAAPAAAAAAAKVQPDAGTYPMSISGTSSVDGKPSTVPSSGSLVVSGTGDQTIRTTGVPGGLVLTQRATPAGVDLISFSLSAGSKTLTFRPSGPVAYVRTTPGASWSWSVKSTDGTVGVSQTASVSGGGSINVGGTSVPTVVVSRTFTVTGAVQGTVRLTSTVSQADRLPLVQHQVINVKATVLLLSTRIVSDTTATLTSTRPR
jgi:hypothetical protein